MDFYDLISTIPLPNENAMKLAKEHQASLAKPPGSLGQLEDIAIKLSGITGKLNNHIHRKHLLVFAADNGVCEENISSAPQSVTLAQTINLTRGKTGAAVLAKHFGCELTIVDVGVAADINEPAVVKRKIAYGTNNIVKEAAMTREQALSAISIGFDMAKTIGKNADILGIGEMGIGNTTTSSAILSVLSHSPVVMVTGRGGGITDEAYKRKLCVIQKALETNNPDANDPIDVLSKVGGFDIAAMTGAFLGAAYTRVPVVIDGFISAVAALVAYRLCEPVRHYLIPSHASFEIGYEIAMRELKLTPMLNLGMRLGEGSGCPLAFEIVSAACAIMNNMATFDAADIDDSYLDEIRTGDNFTVGDNT